MRLMRLSIAASLVVALTLTVAVARRNRQVVRPTLAPYNGTGTYNLGDKVGWTVTLPAGADGSDYGFKLKKNNAETILSGPIDLSSGKAVIETTSTEPEMLYLEVQKGGGRPFTFGAAVAPTKLKPVLPKPRDFDGFWKSKIAELEAIPPNPVLTPVDSGIPDVFYATVKMDHLNGTHVYGQIAWPTTPGKHPAMLILQWASPPYPLDRSWVLNRAKEGWIALNIEPHDVLPTEPRSYYAALPDNIKRYERVGADDRDKDFFVEMYLRDYRAADYLTTRSNWDGKTLLVTGGSMGGQQSLCVAGLHPKITHVIVEEPAGCDLTAGLHGRQEGYPFWDVKDDKAMATAPYIDCINFASHIRATSLVAMGYTDNVAPPTGIWTAFNQIRGKKEAAPMPEAPHNNLATPLQQKPYYDRSAAWMNALVKGEPAPVQ